MNKKMVFALLLAVASGSSVVAMDPDKSSPADKGFGTKAADSVTGALGSVLKVATWPAKHILNLQKAPVLRYFFNKKDAKIRQGLTRYNPRGMRFLLTVALGYGLSKNKTVKKYAEKVKNSLRRKK